MRHKNRVGRPGLGRDTRRVPGRRSTSLSSDNGNDILHAVVPVLDARLIDFKVALDRRVLAMMNSKRLKRCPASSKYRHYGSIPSVPPPFVVTQWLRGASRPCAVRIVPRETAQTKEEFRMNRILALHAMSTQFVSDVMAGSDESNNCSSESAIDCSSQSIHCKDNQGFVLEW